MSPHVPSCPIRTEGEEKPEGQYDHLHTNDRSGGGEALKLG